MYRGAKSAVYNALSLTCIGVDVVLDDPEPGQRRAVRQLSGSDGGDVPAGRRRPRRAAHVLPGRALRHLLEPQPQLVHVQPQPRQHPLADRRHRGRSCRRVERLSEHGGAARPRRRPRLGRQAPWQQRQTRRSRRRRTEQGRLTGLIFSSSYVMQGPNLQNILRFIVRLSLVTIVRLTYDSDLKSAKTSFRNIVS